MHLNWADNLLGACVARVMQTAGKQGWILQARSVQQARSLHAWRAASASAPTCPPPSINQSINQSSSSDRNDGYTARMLCCRGAGRSEFVAGGPRNNNKEQALGLTPSTEAVSVGLAARRAWGGEARRRCTWMAFLDGDGDDYLPVVGSTSKLRGMAQCERARLGQGLTSAGALLPRRCHCIFLPRSIDKLIRSWLAAPAFKEGRAHQQVPDHYCCGRGCEQRAARSCPPAAGRPFRCVCLCCLFCDCLSIA